MSLYRRQPQISIAKDLRFFRQEISPSCIYTTITISTRHWTMRATKHVPAALSCGCDGTPRSYYQRRVHLLLNMRVRERKAKPRFINMVIQANASYSRVDPSTDGICFESPNYRGTVEAPQSTASVIITSSAHTGFEPGAHRNLSLSSLENDLRYIDVSSCSGTIEEGFHTKVLLKSKILTSAFDDEDQQRSKRRSGLGDSAI